jgi:hypothetical protein
LIKRIIHLFVIVFTAGLLFFSCEKENYVTTGGAKLAFSLDTLMFDTIFTSIGSTTQSFRVINPHNQSVLVSSIKLAGGDHSSYRLNIDGEMVNEIEDITIPANDSIYIFVELTVDPNGVNQPMVVMDSVLFETNGSLQDVNLMAWGQDFVPYNREVVNTITWTADKPYLLYDTIFVDSLQTLTIEPGTKIYFHKRAALLVGGTIIAKGTPEKPITFQGDRLEELYNDVPDQWGGILIFPNITENVFENVQIKNAQIGLQVGTIEYPGLAYVRLHNVKIEHMGTAGIFAIKSSIIATNTLIADCGYFCVALLVGGYYDFTHCTVANYWGTVSNRKTPAVFMSNFLRVETDSLIYNFRGDLVKADWKNSIIYGNMDTEVGLLDSLGGEFNFNFDHCLVKLAQKVDVSNTSHYNELIKIADVLFTNTETYNYVPDSLSPVRDIGARYYGEEVPYDLNNVSRLSDTGPDLGAYEYIYDPKKEK